MIGIGNTIKKLPLYFQYAYRVGICLAVIGLTSCKDLKNWSSPYVSHVTIEFGQKRDAAGHLASLRTCLLQRELFYLKLDRNAKSDGYRVFMENLEKLPERLKNKIVLEPNVTSFSFELYNTDYYHKVIVTYDTVTSLISPEAGGIQRKYTIKQIELIEETAPQADGTPARKPIFCDYRIKKATLKKEKRSVNVKLFY
ncbi:hypothetical protein [Candidatus Cardinium hertigii]|uniref:Uncharacterized protein n=1 Tax=Candidatus Cardinium hertigii TaxID=247481 RepID=A0A2Z3L6E9_9BACT|nr:hypothetical protein [Candidatus Cardinium hertigii]AWN81378.1 hypothetical protein DK880_00040 [Candidatus Cardinium hertigii]